ncbi:MAG: hypothetical protein K2N38_10230 [Oscillospiraceae bacterium]|nr:hypothetical protein [Oscillospiraceae bacterium]
MLPKDKRICPCCGKRLELVPPSPELLPLRVGTSSNRVEYYFPSHKRYTSLTADPHSRYWQCAANKLTYHGDLNKRFIKYESRYGKRGWEIVPVYNTQRKLEKDGLWIFSPEMAFFCGKCQRKLSINRNPLAIFGTAMSVWFVVAVVVLCVLAVVVINDVGLVRTAGIVIALLAGALFVIIAEAAAETIFTVRMMSNFVPTDEYDNLIYPPTDIKLSAALRSPYLREGNVLTAKLADGEVHIYLVRKADNCEFSICCEDGEREQLKQRLSECTELELTFEGRRVGTTEIIAD